MDQFRFPILTLIFALISGVAHAQTNMVPVRLRAGDNVISHIAGDGRSGTISLAWRENGNAWSYDIFTVTVGGSVVTHELDGQTRDSFRDAPHYGEDMVTSVRFARGWVEGRNTLIALVADRNWQNSVPEPARVTIRLYALTRNSSGSGTPYEFVEFRRIDTRRQYCHADMALRTELGLPLSGSYSGQNSPNGC